MTTDQSRRPVVAVFIKGLGIGGAEKLISEGSQHWDRAAFDYRVVYVLPWKDQLVPDLEARDVPVVCVGGNRGRLLTAAVNLRRVLTQWNAALVHAHLPSAGLLARLVSSAPVVYTEHNLAWTYRTPTRVANRLTYGRNAAVTAVSQAVADSLAGFRGPVVETIPNGVAVLTDSHTGERVRRELGLSDDQSLVVHVGNIRPGKGHDVLLDMAAELARLGIRATVVSIGGEKYPGDLDVLRKLATNRALDGYIRFLGRRADARDFIAAADVYVNPADFEGLPVSILEAMAAGRPIVATAVGGVTSVIENGVNGRLVAPRSPQDLAAAVSSVLEAPERAAAYGRKAAQTVAREYGLEAMIRRFEATYRRLLT